VNFAASIVIFYFTDLLSVTLRYHVGHEFMIQEASSSVSMPMMVTPTNAW
jgi:hypothetical protein